MAHISLKNVGVEFIIYDVRGRSLRKELMRIGTGGRIAQDENDRVSVNALTDITLDVHDGDRLALIGHNGAGKSTLLRVMAGIYEPVYGSIEISGKVAPLFDLMLGMDPDSTGIENIRLRGLYLDLSPAEIESRIEDITEFSKLGNFLHMPIRTYSSGMAVRLAFATMTSIRPDIVVMDEVIGTGDAAFIKSARNRLESFMAKAGIVVLASHSLDVLKTMCNRGAVLHHGAMHFIGAIDDAIECYQELSRAPS
jgi:ABC-2 type transport system ATP-binding protein/lipopolysaccharide transport system ATP-binding protein